MHSQLPEGADIVGDQVGVRSEKLTCFIVDYGVHSMCNLACRYCREVAVEQKPRNPRELALSMEALSAVVAHVDAVMFKTSGWGEISIVPDYPKLFHRARSLGFEILQMITNGIRIPDQRTLEELRELGHFSLQLSLDGSTQAANALRFWNNPSALQRVIRTLDLSLATRIPVEVNTVLTMANLDNLAELLTDLRCRSETACTPILCMPRPVQMQRAEQETVMPLDQGAVTRLEDLVLGRFDEFASVLPTRRYLEGLIYFLRRQERPWRAFDTAARVTIGARGELALPGEDAFLGNIAGKDCEAAFEARRRHHRPAGDSRFAAKLTQFEVHFLYLAGAIDWDDMARIPSCNNPIAKARLDRLRAAALP